MAQSRGTPNSRQDAGVTLRGILRREKTSVSQEDYLKAIWEIVQEEQVPISARLAEDLGVTPPAVTAALKRMAGSGYLRVRRGGQIELSAKGKGIAQHLVLRHRLAEKLPNNPILAGGGAPARED